MARDDDNSGRNLAIVGGGAALVWLLLRGGGGFGLGGSAGGGAAASGATATTTPKLPRAKVRVDALGVHIDGLITTIPYAAAVVKERGEADVLVTGGARSGTADDLIKALRATGAKLFVTGYSHA